MNETATDSKRAVIAGSSFAGLTAAFELRKRLDSKHEVVVIEPRDHFNFIPSLIWVLFGMRDPDDVTFKLEPVHSKKGIGFINEWVTGFDLDNRKVMTSGGQEVGYDSLLVAAGPKLAFDRTDGPGPENGYTQMSETMAKVAAQNMAADIQGGERREMPMSEMEAICILDAGNAGIIFKADHVLGESEHPHVMSGPQAHWAKIAFEKIYLNSRKHGHPIL